MIKRMRFVIGVILFLIGFGCIIAGAIWQQVLCYEMFGVIFKQVFIPHYSAWLYLLGAIPMFVGSIMSGIK